MDVVVHYSSMCMLSDQSQHNDRNDVLGNQPKRMRTAYAGVYICLTSQVCRLHFAADVAALGTSASICIVHTISFQAMWVWSRSNICWGRQGLMTSCRLTTTSLQHDEPELACINLQTMRSCVAVCGIAAFSVLGLLAVISLYDIYA